MMEVKFKTNCDDPVDWIHFQSDMKDKMPGLTKLELFSAMAMIGLLANNKKPIIETPTEEITCVAVAMGMGLVKTLNKSSDHTT